MVEPLSEQADDPNNDWSIGLLVRQVEEEEDRPEDRYPSCRSGVEYLKDASSAGMFALVMCPQQLLFTFKCQVVNPRRLRSGSRIRPLPINH